jgi:hypothetical protein
LKPTFERVFAGLVALLISTGATNIVRREERLISSERRGIFAEGNEAVTIVFDAQHKVSIQLGITAGVLETS